MYTTMHLLSGLLIIDAVNDGNLPTIVTGISTHHNPSHHVQTRERCNAKSIHKKSMYWFEDMNVKSFVHYTSIESTSPRLMREATIIIRVGYHSCSSILPAKGPTYESSHRHERWGLSLTACACFGGIDTDLATWTGLES